ncbi:MAG TPA: hypothetical protein VKU41_28230 [Polyangiaceae bacterium]|nr:hypothetical protein [Polyangiaceae bacterium]
MPGRLLPIAFFAGFVLALSTLARPALASVAPFSDDRGATAVAPPPALEAPDEAITRARVSSDHPTWRWLHAAIVPPHSGGAPEAAQGVDPVVEAPTPKVQAAPHEGAVPVDPTPARAGPGERSRVERPPRG